MNLTQETIVKRKILDCEKLNCYHTIRILQTKRLCDISSSVYLKIYSDSVIKRKSVLLHTHQQEPPWFQATASFWCKTMQNHANANANANKCKSFSFNCFYFWPLGTNFKAWLNIQNLKQFRMNYMKNEWVLM